MGFPRNVSQAEFLDKLLAEIGQKYNFAIDLNVPQEVLVARLLDRAKIQNRPDDTEEVIRRRLVVYDEQTAPLIDYYQHKGVFRSVNGDRELSAVTQDFRSDRELIIIAKIKSCKHPTSKALAPILYPLLK